MGATEIRRVFRTYPKKNWIVWVGAGVSCSAPSNLPLGLPLTRWVLDQVLGRSESCRLGDIWRQANDVAGTPTLPEPFGPGPRLETVLEIVERVQSALVDGRFDMQSGLRSFAEAPFNTNHLCLAQMILDGATVVTTNFDMCIQKAYQALVGPSMPLEGVRIDRVYRFTSQAPRVGTLWHIHGVAHDIAGLGATIRSVKQGLSTEFAQELDRMISDRSLVVFMGYGAGDSFDVTPFFADKSTGLFADSCALYLQHTGSSVPRGVSTLLEPFGGSLVEDGDTASWLREMADRAHYPGICGGRFNWQDRYLAMSDPRDLAVVRPFALCRLARELGVSYEKLNEQAYPRALAVAGSFEAWEFHRTLAFSCRMRRKSRQERNHDRQAGDTDLLGYNYSKGNLRKALRLARSLDAIQSDSTDTTGELDWSVYTSLSAHARSLISGYVYKPWRRRVTSQDAATADRLLLLATRLADRPLKNVIYLNQVTTAMRFCLLLSAILFGKESLNTEERVFSLYREASSIQGYVSSYRDCAIKRILLAQLHGRRDKLGEASYYCKKSSKLARIIGDVDGARRAYYLGLLTRVCRALY